MLNKSKATIFLFYLSILQFTAAYAVMTGKNLELAKTTQATTTATVVPDREIHSTTAPTPTMQKIYSIHPNGRRLVIAQVFGLEQQPCEVNDSSSNKMTFNCSSTSSVSPRVKQCGLNSRLVGESCMCNQGYKKFPLSDDCVKGNGQPCMFHQNDCSTELTNLACINNVCSCEDSDIYDHITFQCVGRVGGLCYPEIKDCVLNAECVNVPKRVLRRREASSPTSSSSDNNYYYYETDTDQLLLTDYVFSSTDIELSGRCQCKEGFVESSNLCRKAYGKNCTFGDECSSSLVCKEGNCLCSDSLHVYDLVSKSCVALVGAKCSNEPGGTLCVKHAICEKTNLNTDGRCACIEDAVETHLGTCVHSEATLPILYNNNNGNSEPKSNRILFNY